MAIVNINVYPYVSPRIIEIPAPATEITIQDLVDSCRDWEDSEFGEYFPHLINASGKEDLGGGVLVGITAELQNAKVAFQQRPAWASDGTATTGDSLGRTLIDNTATFVSDGIIAGDTVLNKTDNSSATVISVDSEIQLTTFALEGGTDNDWDIGDSYLIWNKIQCEVTGGNLVAVNDVGASISAFLPTAFTHVIRTSSSSATLSEQADIQYASFNGGVSINVINGYAGTGKNLDGALIGTPRAPSNNTDDALIIATNRGFTTFYIIGNITLNSGTDFLESIFVGSSQVKSLITIDASADVNNCEFYDSEIAGTLDGGNVLKDCLIGNLDYVNGFIERCIIGPGTITLSGANDAHFLDCWSGVIGQSTPIIDMGGSGQALAMRNYAGGVKIRNKTGTEEVSLDLVSGQIILDSTVTNGVIVARGVGKLVDTLGNHIPSGTWNGGVTILNELMNVTTVSESVWDEDLSLHSDGTSGKVLSDLWQILGLDNSNPLTIGTTQHTVGGITLNVTCNPDNSVTIERQP